MTPDDRTPDSRPHDGSTSEEFASTEARLRATLRDVAANVTPTDGLDRLRAAVEPGRTAERPDGTTATVGDAAPSDPVVLPLLPARAARSARVRGVVAVAAALLVVVGLGAVLVSQRDGGGSSADLAGAGTHADAEANPDRGGGDPHDPTTSTTTGTTRPNDPEQPGPGTDPGDSRTTIEDAWAFAEQFDPLDGLTFALVVDQTSVAAGQAVGARLQITNTTSEDRTIHECSAIQTGITFVPADAPSTAVPVPQIIDCYRTPMVEIPAGDTADLAFTPDGYLGPLSARRIGERGGVDQPLGALEPGDYLATAVLPGSDRTVRVQVPVTITAPMCDGFTDELARAVGDKDEAEATTAARDLGFDLRTVVVDGVGQAVTDDLRCDRVNAIISGGRVIDLAGVY